VLVRVLYPVAEVRSAGGVRAWWLLPLHHLTTMMIHASGSHAAGARSRAGSTIRIII
jgi:hypothetical protein